MKIKGMTLQLWHDKLGPINVDTIKLMGRTKVVGGLHICNPKAHLKLCETCAIGKNLWLAFPIIQ